MRGVISPSTSSGTVGFLILILFGFFTVASAQLPPEIRADAYLLQVEQAIRDGDLDRARTVIQNIRILQEQHDLDLQDEFHFRYAKAAGAIGMPEQALESVVKYLAAAGRQGQHYVEALELMNKAQAASSRVDVSAQLSPNIMADAYLLQVEQAIRDGDLDHSRAVIQDILNLQEQHELDLPDAFHFRYAKAAAAADLPEQALESVVKYLTVSGREGQYYGDALALMNRAQIGVSCRGWDTGRVFQDREPRGGDCLYRRRGRRKDAGLFRCHPPASSGEVYPESESHGNLAQCRSGQGGGGR